MATESTPLVTPPAAADPHPRRKQRLVVSFAAVLALTAVTTASLLWPHASSSSSSTPVHLDFFCGITDFESGYVTLANKKDDHYFYWYVPSSSEQPDKDPLVLWLTGGPGGPSTLALLSENGPCLVQPDATGKLNEHAWSSNANVIWLDQPTNVGFSYGLPEDEDSTSADVGKNIFWFLQGFLDKHPELQGREFFITGESYGGHYVPAAAHYLWQQSNLKDKTKTNASHAINLQGIAIGNGFTDPVIQNPHYIDMVDNVYNVTFVNASELAVMRTAAIECGRLMTAAGENMSLGMDAESFCQDNLDMKMDVVKRNPYDIRERCDKEQKNECIPTDHIGRFLEQPHVRELLNVSVKANAWQMVNFDVNAAFAASGDIVVSFSSSVADLLNAGVRVLIYAGDADLACNWYGNQAWVQALEWEGKEGFNAVKEHMFVTTGGAEAGVARSFENRLTFLRVFNAGHMVPLHQPEAALDMINRFFRNHQV